MTPSSSLVLVPAARDEFADHPGHPDPHERPHAPAPDPDPSGQPDDELMFRFEKRMAPAGRPLQ